MTQLEATFQRVAPSEGELEYKPKDFDQFVQPACFRDWPAV